MAEIDLGKVANDISDNGSYNLIPFPYHGGIVPEGMIFSTKEDGSITAKKGDTSSDGMGYIMVYYGKLALGKYRLNGCQSGGSSTSYELAIYKDWVGFTNPDIGNGIIFDVDDAAANYIIQARAMYKNVSDEITFKPMLVKVDDNGNYPTTYMRGSIMSNRELSDAIGSKTLNTTAKDLSGAINEHEQNIVDLDTKVGAAALNTTAQDLSSAINEVNGKFKKHFVGTAKDSTTNDQGCITLAVNVTSYFPNGIVVECVYVEDYVAIPFLWNNNMWYAKILSPWADTASIKSTEIGEATFTYYVL